MRTFQYTIKDAVGIHARPAGLLAKTAKALNSTVTIALGDKKADAAKLLALMGMGIRCGDTITVTVEGGDEIASEQAMRDVFEANL